MTATPPVAPPGVDQTNPKASAKAAKAYAKATRPWYKKKRYVGAIALVAIIGIASASGGGNDDPAVKASPGSSSKGETDAKGDSAKGAVGTEGNPASRGTAVQNKSAKYEVLGVKVTDTLPGPFGSKPAGKYVIVDLSVTNVKDESIQFGTGDFTLIVNGNEIDVDDDTFILDDGFSYDELSPGLTKQGKVVFDVAAKDAGKGVLMAQAQLSLDDPVYLSLK